MIRKYLFKYLVIIMFITSASTSLAEGKNDLYLGALFNISKNFHQKIVYQFDDNKYDPNCNYTFINEANATKAGLGIILEYLFYKKTTISNFVNLRISFEQSSFEQFGLSRSYEGLVKDETFPTRLEEKKFPSNIKEKIDISSINFDLFYKILFSNSVKTGIIIGPYITIPLETKSYEEKVIYSDREIVSLNHATYSQKDNTYHVFEYEGEIKNVNQFYFGFKFNYFYEILFSDLIKTTAEVGYALPLTYFAKDSEWKIESFYANLIISIKLNHF